MITSFKSKETEKIFKRYFSHKVPHDIQKVVFRKLKMLNRANILNDLRVPPSNHLEVLTGDRAGQYSIRVNKRWRICFEWFEGEVKNVEIVDYH
ncbi:MAG: plasmid maintenance system killer [Candidatus Schekmanbacteria bacterium RBG_13_48_7]|uniref:Plasmid maintenance system killer n=1 Tax=Candidatus Schekmanbacteria bacterium RBG_13_48_7 TaxID=1817878 RepID=A0A1F7RXJ9_9BACT|nr:MAG: plasmid maintenance system killer [Candidatus Schekmanbacteria bacterium RBG_13_48_7]